MTEKTCSQCQGSKPVDAFQKGQSRCKQCYKEDMDKQRLWDKEHPEESRYCPYCCQDKLVRDFTPAQKRCKQCCCDFQAGRREADLKKDPDSLRVCSKCHESKPIREFIPGSWCKKCHSTNHHNDHLRRPERYLLHGAKNRAKRDGLPIDITEGDIYIPQVCPDLGLTLAPATDKVRPNSPTLDRIIPELGYTKGNVRVVSSQSNRMKQETTILQSASIWSNVLRSLPEGYTLDIDTCEALRHLARSIQGVLQEK